MNEIRSRYDSTVWHSVSANAGFARQYLGLLQQLLAKLKQHTSDQLRLAPGHRVLEIGCGTGKDAEDLAHRVAPSGHVLATDFSDTLIEEAIARTAGLGLPLEFRVADGHALPFPDESFDAVRIERTLQHIADPRQAVREMARVTRPGGRVAAFEPDWDTISISSSDRAITRQIRHRLADQYHTNATIGRELPALLAAAGYREIVAEGVSFHTQSLDVADNVMHVRAAIDEAVDEGELSIEVAHAWWSELDEQDRAGTFYACMSGTIASGTKPG